MLPKFNKQGNKYIFRITSSYSQNLNLEHEASGFDVNRRCDYEGPITPTLKSVYVNRNMQNRLSRSILPSETVSNLWSSESYRLFQLFFESKA